MSQDHDGAPIVGTHVYTLSAGWKAFLLAFAAIIVIGPLVAIGFIHEDPVISFEGAVFLDLLLLVFAALGIVAAFACVRYRLLLTPDGIEQRQAFTSRRLRNHEIAGRRVFQVNSAPATIELVPRDGAAKKMQISRAMKTDQVFEDWLAAFPEVDLRDEQRFQQEVQADPAYGGHPAERLRRLSQLRNFTEWAGGLGTAIALWGMVYPHPYTLVVTLLAACPLLGLVIVMGSGGRIHIDQKARDKRPTVVFLVMLPAIALALRAFLDVSLLDWPAALVVAAVGGALFALVAMLVDTEERRWPAFLLTMGMVGMPWCYGLAVESNVRFDRGAPRVYRTTVIAKHETTGKGHALYLTVAPWGPVRGRGDEVVDRDLYDGTVAGDTVCVSLNDGAFGWRWYWLDRCPGD